MADAILHSTAHRQLVTCLHSNSGIVGDWGECLPEESTDKGGFQFFWGGVPSRESHVSTWTVSKNPLSLRFGPMSRLFTSRPTCRTGNVATFTLGGPATIARLAFIRAIFAPRTAE